MLSIVNRKEGAETDSAAVGRPEVLGVPGPRAPGATVRSGGSRVFTEGGRQACPGWVSGVRQG